MAFFKQFSGLTIWKCPYNDQKEWPKPQSDTSYKRQWIVECIYITYVGFSWPLGRSLIILKSLQLVSFTDSFVQLLSALQTVFLPLEKQNSLIYCQKADNFFASTARWRCCCCCCFPCFPGKDQIRRHCLSIVDPVTTKYHDYFYFFKFDVPYNWYHA